MRERWHPSGWFVSRSGSRAENCCQMGSMMYGGNARARAYSLCSASVENSPHDGTSCARFSRHFHPYLRKLLFTRVSSGPVSRALHSMHYRPDPTLFRIRPRHSGASYYGDLRSSGSRPCCFTKSSIMARAMLTLTGICGSSSAPYHPASSISPISGASSPPA